MYDLILYRLTTFTLSGMRGSTPLDVAAASCIDNNELALALQEQDLEMVRDPQGDKLLLLQIFFSHSSSVAGGEVPGGLWSAELPHALIKRIPRYRVEPLWRREVPGFPQICCIR